jgi:hypothetical protein
MSRKMNNIAYDNLFFLDPGCSSLSASAFGFETGRPMFVPRFWARYVDLPCVGPSKVNLSMYACNS